MRDDVGDLKGLRAESKAVKEVAFIADQLGLALTRVLTVDDLLAMLRAQPLPDLPSNVRASFLRRTSSRRPPTNPAKRATSRWKPRTRSTGWTRSGRFATPSSLRA